MSFAEFYKSLKDKLALYQDVFQSYEMKDLKKIRNLSTTKYIFGKPGEHVEVPERIVFIGPGAANVMSNHLHQMAENLVNIKISEDDIRILLFWSQQLKKLYTEWQKDQDMNSDI